MPKGVFGPRVWQPPPGLPAGVEVEQISRVLETATFYSRQGVWGVGNHQRVLALSARAGRLHPWAARQGVEFLLGKPWPAHWRDLLMARGMEWLARGYYVPEVQAKLLYPDRYKSAAEFRRHFREFSERCLGRRMGPGEFRSLALLGREEKGEPRDSNGKVIRRRGRPKRRNRQR